MKNIQKQWETVRNRCRRCWDKLEERKDLWCKHCRELVDLEWEGKTHKPIWFYFAYYNKWKTLKKKTEGWKQL